MEISYGKTILAKLLAEENIEVRFKNSSTSSFDIKNRVLTFPAFIKSVGDSVVYLMLSHECGHALYTYENDVLRIVDIAKEFGLKEKQVFSVFNVLEDVRIDKLVKRKYPGLIRDYSNGYKELHEKNFFGILDKTKEELDQYNFIDRINLYTKPGIYFKFNSKEESLLNEVLETETPNDVYIVTRKVIQYMLDIGLDKKFNPLDTIDKKEEISVYIDDDVDIESLTQKEFNKSLEEIIDSKNLIYLDVPKIDLSELVITNKTVYNCLKDQPFTNKIDEFMDASVNSVNHLVKEFRLRKNASLRKKIRERKTGDLNLQKMYKYQFDDNIFKVYSQKPKEQSHGLVIYLDWSSSMFDTIIDSIKKVLTLIMFCNKVGIPYELYAFTSMNLYMNNRIRDQKINEVIMNNFRMLHLLSSTMSRESYKNISNALLSVQSMINPTFRLGNTPLNTSLLILPELYETFRLKHKNIDKINVVVITDGESDTLTFCNGYGGYDYISGDGYKYYVKKDGMMFDTNWKTQTNDILRGIRNHYNIRMFGFMLVNNVTHSEPFRKNGCVKSANHHYDEFYYVKQNSKDDKIFLRNFINFIS